MRKVLTILKPVVILVGAAVAGGAGGGCSSDSKPGGSASGGKLGTGGSVIGQGGLAVGGAIASGGSGGAGASGGTTASGSGGAAGYRVDGGDGTGGLGAGGTIKGGAGGGTIVADGGTITGGAGVKGGTDGGVGGSGGTAGAGGGSVDGGTPDAPLPKCSEVTTQAECDARDDCYSVFEDKNDCGCATPGCCARFKSCSAGSAANCLGNALCEVIAPVCNPPYVLAYKSLCYEGCVFEDDCAILPCPKSAPQNGSACSPANGTCYYEDCAGAGRTLASCVDRSWKVETAACDAYACQAPGTDGGALTCAAGQICVVTTDTSFRVTASCQSQTCGARPMSTSCISGLTGQCSPRYKLGGVVVSCAMPVPSEQRDAL